MELPVLASIRDASDNKTAFGSNDFEVFRGNLRKLEGNGADIKNKLEITSSVVLARKHFLRRDLHDTS